jgi:negative regulator of flagellin synthesis FlgM
MAGIDNIRSGQSLTTNNRSTARSEENASSVKAGSAKSLPRAGQDAVSLSSQGRAIGEMHSQLASEPSFDSAKVAAIKEAISNGSYTVDADKLAENMIKFEKEFGGFN